MTFFIHKEMFRVPILLRKDTLIEFGTLQEEMHFLRLRTKFVAHKAGMTDSTPVGVFSQRFKPSLSVADYTSEDLSNAG
jgi:hypothetical protein